MLRKLLPYAAGAALAVVLVGGLIAFGEWAVQGWRAPSLDWDAVAAVATTAAVIVALYEAGRAGRAERRKDAAILSALLTISGNLEEVLKRRRADIRAGRSPKDVAASFLGTDGLEKVEGALARISPIDLPEPAAVDALMTTESCVTMARQIFVAWREGTVLLPMAQLDSCIQSVTNVCQSLYTLERALQRPWWDLRPGPRRDGR